ncbi:MAG: PDDEXK nuclease domain-containing protein [Azoarcus sp.]|jgi:predicted nuclease of restriction endonuclease-like (RecB) superfamily|nr:PDDEXK nuclease domain-containing protein [Azoarcus sp.]
MKQKEPITRNSSEITKKGAKVAVSDTSNIDEATLYDRVAAIIDHRKARAGAYANREVTLMYWEIGHHINSTLLGGERAEYGKRIVATLARQLQEKYGNSFDYTNVRRMMQFAARFPEIEIVAPLAQQLSWSHFTELLPLKSDEAFMYYANDAAVRRLGKRELRHQIDRRAYERREIANSNLTDESSIPFNVFKDPYILDTLGLKENFKETDLEKAILTELGAFIMEFGHGLTFVGRQKRFTFDGEDFYPDLLFYHRDLKRLIVIELKIGKFKAEYKGQMEMYLKWLNRYERRKDENAPIGLLLCTKASRDQIELLELDKAGIAVAEYWTVLPPKAELERKINEIMLEAKERLARRKSLSSFTAYKQIDYFYEPKDDANE